MQTRSKAMKRSANDDISVSPTKTQRRQPVEKSASAKSDATEVNEDIENAKTPDADKPQEEIATTEEDDAKNAEEPANPDAAKPIADREKSAATAEEERKDEVPTRSMNGPGRGGDDKDEQDEDDKEDSEERANTERQKEDKKKAIQMLLQLSLVLEKRRVMERGSTLLGTQPAGMIKLCELAAKPDLALNSFLGFLPFNFYWEMQEVEKAVVKANEAKEKLDTLDVDVVAAGKAHNDALIKRSFALLRVKDHSEQALEAHNAAVSSAFDALSKAREFRNRANEEWEALRRTVDRLCEVPFQKAEAALIEEGHLQPLEPDQRGSGQHSSSDRTDLADEADRARKEAVDHRRGSQSIEQHHERWREDQYPRQSDARQPDKDRDQPFGGVQDQDRNTPRRSVVNDIRKSKQRYLDHARRQCLDTENKFDAVRHDYYRDLDAFLEARREGRVDGTKSEFDHAYYLERAQANHDFAMACRNWEFALEEADRTDALTRSQRRDFLGDWDESDHGSGSFVRDAIWDCTEERIEAWRNDEGMGEIQGEQHWLSMQQEVEQEGKSIAELSELELQSSLATGRRRKMIDERQVQGERDRVVVAEQMAELKAKEKAEQEAKEGAERRVSNEKELPWWQLCTGI